MCPCDREPNEVVQSKLEGQSTEEFLPSTSCTWTKKSALVSTKLQPSLDATANTLVASGR